VAILVTTFFIFRKKKVSWKKRPGSAPIQKEIVVKVLESISKEFFGILMNVAMLSQQFQNQTTDKVTDKELMDYLVTSNTGLQSEIANLIEQCCESQGINSQDFGYDCHVTYKTDPKVKNLLKQRNIALENAASGKIPDCDVEIPKFLTPDRIFHLLKEVAKRSVNTMKSAVVKLMSDGIEISASNSAVLEKLSSLKLDTLRKQIFKEEGLDKFGVSSMQLFQSALLKYTKEDPDKFNEKLKKFDEIHEAIMSKLMEGNIIEVENLLKKI